MDFDLAIGIQVAQRCSGNLCSVFPDVSLPKVELRREIRQGHGLGVAQRERLDACQRQVLGCSIPRQCACLHQRGGRRTRVGQMRGGRRALRRARPQDSTRTAPISMPRPLQPNSRMLLTCQGQHARTLSAAAETRRPRVVTCTLRRRAPSTRRSNRGARRRRLCGRDSPQGKCCGPTPGRQSTVAGASSRARRRGAQRDQAPACGAWHRARARRAAGCKVPRRCRSASAPTSSNVLHLPSSSLHTGERDERRYELSN
jgi:hypothetical protein